MLFFLCFCPIRESYLIETRSYVKNLARGEAFRYTRREGMHSLTSRQKTGKTTYFEALREQHVHETPLRPVRVVEE